MALLTKANTIVTLEGSRLQPGDALDASRPTRIRHQPHVGDKGKPEGRTKSPNELRAKRAKKSLERGVGRPFIAKGHMTGACAVQ